MSVLSYNIGAAFEAPSRCSDLFVVVDDQDAGREVYYMAEKILGRMLASSPAGRLATQLFVY